MTFKIKRYMQCLEENENPGNNSVCDSFTIITSLAGAECSSLMVPNSNKTNNSNSNHGFMSTFSPSAQQRLVEEDEENSIMDSPPITTATATNIQTVNTDLGYYGSSDYSDNNSFNVCAKQIIKQARVKYVQNGVKTTNNSAASFNSSSLLSSPISSSSTDASTSPLFNNPKSNQTPIITNLYPFNYFKVTNKQLDPYNIIDEVAKVANASNDLKSRQTSTNPDVKLYLERFERIYNSNESDASTEPKPTHNRINSHTSYSYV